jgi:hypothetical protein
MPGGQDAALPRTAGGTCIAAGRLVNGTPSWLQKFNKRRAG